MTLFQHDSSTWESVSCWATSLDHRGQKGPGTGCFSRAITGPDSDPTARHLKPLPWCPVEAMVSDSEKATERSQGSSASCGKLLLSVPLLPALVTSRVEKASIASTKTETADLNQEEDLAFICKQSWLYNISVYI